MYEYQIVTNVLFRSPTPPSEMASKMCGKNVCTWIATVSGLNTGSAYMQIDTNHDNSTSELFNMV